MKTLVILSNILLSLALGQCCAQAPAENNDTLATFPGGDSAFDRFVGSNLLTTHEALLNHIEGDIELSFIIDDKGYAGDIKPLKKLGYGCDEQAMRVLRLMPRWQPGVIGGRRIKSTLQRSFHFSPALTVNEDEKAISREMQPNAAPQFGQKDQDLATYIEQHFVYPVHAPKNLDAALVLQFKVNEDGVTSDIQIVSGLGQGFDEEAIRVIRNMPAWTPKQVNFRATVSYKELVIGFKKGKALLY